MRGRVASVFVLVLGVWSIVPGRVFAQQGYRGDDILRPYAPHSTRASSTGYSRTPAPRQQPIARPQVQSQGVRDYFPGMRLGYGPNRNTVDPRRLCVPGRRAMLMVPQQSTMMSPMGGLVTGAAPIPTR
jgi:hypothetical protein